MKHFLSLPYVIASEITLFPWRTEARVITAKIEGKEMSVSQWIFDDWKKQESCAHWDFQDADVSSLDKLVINQVNTCLFYQACKVHDIVCFGD